MLKVVNNKAATVGVLPDTCVRCVVPFILDSSLHFSAFVGASAGVTNEAPSVAEKQSTPSEAIVVVVITSPQLVPALRLRGVEGRLTLL